MFRDRGNIKWVSLMLPEHVRLLKEYKQDLQAIEKPIVDEQKYEEFNMIISQAIEENIYLEFTYYQKDQLKQIVGQVHHVNQLNKELIIYEQKYQVLNIIITITIEENIYLEFTYYKKDKLKQIVGQVHHVNQLNKELHIISHSSNSYQISFKNIVEIKSLEDEY